MPKIAISKLEAARRQLDAAIEIYFTMDNPVALHTITAAAYNILRDIAKKSGFEYPFIKRGFVEQYPESKRRLLREFLAAPEKFFKHADRDHEGIIDFDPEMTEIFLMDACSYYRELPKDERPRFYEIFKSWHAVPKAHLDDADKVLIEAIAIALKSKGKREFWGFMRKALNI